MNNQILSEAIEINKDILEIPNILDKLMYTKKFDLKHMLNEMSKVGNIIQKVFGINVRIRILAYNDALTSHAISYLSVDEIGYKSAFKFLKHSFTGKKGYEPSYSDKDSMRELNKVLPSQIKLSKSVYATLFINPYESGLMPLDKSNPVSHGIKKVKYTGRELTAIILHEIGHIAAIDTEILSRLDAYRWSSILSIGLLPIVNAFLALRQKKFFSSLKTGRTITNEISSDTFAIRYGFGADLESALSKIVQLRKEVGAFSDQSYGAREIEVRRSTIKNILETELKKPGYPSELKANIKKQLDSMKKREFNYSVYNLAEATFEYKDEDLGLLTETSLYDNLHTVAGIELNKDCRYLNSNLGIADVIAGKELEIIKTTLRMEIDTANDAYDLLNLNEIYVNCKSAIKKLQTYLINNRTDKDRFKLISITNFIRYVDTLLATEVVPNLRAIRKSIHVDAHKHEEEITSNTIY